jgi:outer membrane protein assembly factor BamD (BamD/ComL family)
VRRITTEETLGKRTRVTKKALKHDAFVDTAAKGTKFVEEHLNKIIIAVAVAVIAAGVVFMVMRSQKKAAGEASALLAVATESLTSGLLAQATDQFNGIIEAYPGTRAAGAATCHLGSIRFHEQDYDGALQFFEKYLSDYGDPGNLRVIALQGKAAILEQRRDFPGAATVYTTLADEAKGQPMSAALDLLSAIRCYRAAQNWQAMRDAAARIVQDYPDTPSAGDARIAYAEASAFLAPE